VTADAFERFSALLLAGLQAARPFDAVYLDLHGAMVTEQYEDGEGELLQRVRTAIGPAMPLVASLDLHSNTTTAMLDNADGLLAYRTIRILIWPTPGGARRAIWTPCYAAANGPPKPGVPCPF
jgi:microcystin degradation protein MlrC